MNAFSQMKMIDMDKKEIVINFKKEKQNIIKVFEDNTSIVYYILNKRDFNLKKGLGANGTANVIFFSKKYNKGLLTIFKQSIYNEKKSIYNITLHTGSNNKYMFVSSMAILDKDFNYKYYVKYSYMLPPPPEKGNYSSWITIQDATNYCSTKRFDLKDNVVYENIDDILSNLPTLPKNTLSKECDPIVYEVDLKDFFSNKIR